MFLISAQRILAEGGIGTLRLIETQKACALGNTFLTAAKALTWAEKDQRKQPYVSCSINTVSSVSYTCNSIHTVLEHFSLCHNSPVLIGGSLFHSVLSEPLLVVQQVFAINIKGGGGVDRESVPKNVSGIVVEAN